MARLFGTDGIRGVANRDIPVDLALKVAQAAAIVLGKDSRDNGLKPKAVIARDPRISGEFLVAAVSAGLAASGVDVFDAGVIPTPAAAYLTADLDADFGVMISASHNPAADNGIKIFARGGHKLPDHIEDAIEKVREALKGSDADAIKSTYDDLQTKFQEVTTAAYKAAAASAAPSPDQEGAASEPQDKKDDVVDAEFEVLDEDKKK